MPTMTPKNHRVSFAKILLDETTDRHCYALANFIVTHLAVIHHSPHQVNFSLDIFRVGIEQGIIINIILWNGVDSWEPEIGQHIVELPSSSGEDQQPGIGWFFSEGMFTPPIEEEVNLRMSQQE